MTGALLAERLAALRASFDAAFAEPAGEQAEEPSRALAIRAADRRLLVRIEELAGVEPCRRIVCLPGGPPGLLGLAGLRGRLVAVYDLAALVGGRPRAGADGAAAGPPPRWLLVCASSPDVALAIDEIEGHVRFTRGDVRPDDGAGAGGHVGEAVLVDGAPRGVLRVPSVAAAVLERAQRGAERLKGDR